MAHFHFVSYYEKIHSFYYEGKIIDWRIKWSFCHLERITHLDSSNCNCTAFTKLSRIIAYFDKCSRKHGKRFYEGTWTLGVERLVKQHWRLVWNFSVQLLWTQSPIKMRTRRNLNTVHGITSAKYASLTNGPGDIFTLPDLAKRRCLFALA